MHLVIADQGTMYKNCMYAWRRQSPPTVKGYGAMANFTTPALAFLTALPWQGMEVLNAHHLKIKYEVDAKLHLALVSL